jgi:hypothetical protein
MRVRIERTFVTTASGTRVSVDQKDYTIVEAESLSRAILDFVLSDGARLLGTISEHGDRKAVATAWKNRVYLLCAAPAPD